jgi:hypothetical protein
MTETEITTVEVLSDLAIAEYRPTAAALADLRARFKDVVFDVATAAGNKEARAARLELVRLRTSLEAKRKELKAPALEHARLIDTEAKRVTAEIVALEEPIDAQIRADEARREREREAKAEAERRRVADIQERIDTIKGFPVRAAGKSSIVIEALIAEADSINVDETFAEYLGTAQAAHEYTLHTLREMLTAALAHEEEARRLRAEREALERRRKEDEARRAEADRIAREEHEAEVARIAEARAAQEAELRAQREAEEARRADERRIEAERVAAEEARLAAERAEIERQRAEVETRQRAEEARLAMEREAAEKAAREREEAARAVRQRLELAAPMLLAACQLALEVLMQDPKRYADAIVAVQTAIAAATETERNEVSA